MPIIGDPQEPPDVPISDGAGENTDRELWRGPNEGIGSYYADSIHVTEGGGIGINIGGRVIVQSLKAWFDGEGRCQRAFLEIERLRAVLRLTRDQLYAHLAADANPPPTQASRLVIERADAVLGIIAPCDDAEFGMDP